MDPNSLKVMAAAAAGGADPTYVEDVFSIQAYVGNATVRTITSPHCDIKTEGGFTIVKNRDSASTDWIINDTASAANKSFKLNSDDDLATNLIKGHTAADHGSVPNGFTLSSDDQVNKNGDEFIGYMFRKCPGFIDVGSYTNAATGSSKTVSHSLGSTPGMIWIKEEGSGEAYVIWHTSSATKWSNISSTAAWTSTGKFSGVSSTSFTVAGNSPGMNHGSSAGQNTYIYYVFANDVQEFGADGNQSIIKCGYYTGTGNNLIDVNLGWEPQYVVTRNISETSNFLQMDTMRGIASHGNDARLYINSQDEEVENGNHIDLTSTGFTVPSGATDSGHTVLYWAIRRPDAYVGRPATAATSVFAMDTGNNSSTIPLFDSPFPVDFALQRQVATAQAWFACNRLMNKKYVTTNTDSDQSGDISSLLWDSSIGWMAESSIGSERQSWMWKRHAGFDIVTYSGTGSDRYISHGMKQAPEMMWIKKRNASKNWYVYHKGLNGGSSPQNYSLRLNNGNKEDNDGDTLWNQTAPTATNFRVNTDNGVNNSGDDYLALLFSSVDDISDIGHYTGNGSTTGPTITTGFQPRLLIVKGTSWTNGGSWWIFDSVRGFGTVGSSIGQMSLNNDNASGAGSTLFQVSATGFSVHDDSPTVNDDGENYIYYAHA